MMMGPLPAHPLMAGVGGPMPPHARGPYPPPHPHPHYFGLPPPPPPPHAAHLHYPHPMQHPLSSPLSQRRLPHPPPPYPHPHPEHLRRMQQHEHQRRLQAEAWKQQRSRELAALRCSPPQSLLVPTSSVDEAGDDVDLGDEEAVCSILTMALGEDGDRRQQHHHHRRSSSIISVQFSDTSSLGGSASDDEDDVDDSCSDSGDSVELRLGEEDDAVVAAALPSPAKQRPSKLTLLQPAAAVCGPASPAAAGPLTPISTVCSRLASTLAGAVPRHQQASRSGIFAFPLDTEPAAAVAAC